MSDWADETSDEVADDGVADAVALWVDAHGDGPDDFAEAVVSRWCDTPATPRGVADLSWIATSVTLAAAAALLLVALGLRTSSRAEAIANLDARDRRPVASTVATVPEPMPASIPEEIPEEIGSLRAQMRGVLGGGCVPCHLGGHPDAVAGALQGFDLAVPQWWQPVSERQLGVLQNRIESTHGPNSREGRLVDAFVRAELAERRG